MFISKEMSEKGYQVFKPCWVHSKVFIQPNPAGLTWLVQQLGEPCEGWWAALEVPVVAGHSFRSAANPKWGLQWRFELCTSPTPKPLMHQGPCAEAVLESPAGAGVTHELSAGPPVAAGNQKELCSLLESCPPLQMLCRQLCSAYLPLRTSEQVEVGPRLICLSCAPSKRSSRTGSCLKWDRDLLLSYTQLCVFHVLWCGSFSLSVSSFPVRMTFFYWFLNWRTNSASSLKHSLVNVLWNMTSVVAIKLQWSCSFWNEKNMSLLALSNTEGQAYSIQELHGCQRWKKNCITFGNFIITVNDNLMKWHCFHCYC